MNLEESAATRSQNTTEPSDETVPETSEELRQEIEQTREELGETVEALAQKTDVKGRVREKVAEGKQAFRDKSEHVMGQASELGHRVQRVSPARAQHVIDQVVAETRQRPLSVCTAFLLGLLLGLVLKKRR